jgi:hypothetical protein
VTVNIDTFTRGQAPTESVTHFLMKLVFYDALVLLFRRRDATGFGRVLLALGHEALLRGTGELLFVGLLLAQVGPCA